MTINNATVEQINVALLDIDKRIKALNIDNEVLKSLQNSIKTIKSSLNEKQAGLQSGATYNINISGNASTATKATTATIAEKATNANHAETAASAGNADTVDNYHASQLWRSDGANWDPSANVTMTPNGNDQEWSFDFRNKNGAVGSAWHVWDENKDTLLKVDADSGQVSAPYGFVGNLSGKADTAGTADYANAPTGFRKAKNDQSLWGNQDGEFITDWETVPAQGADHGDISFRFNNGKLNIIIDGVFYQNQGNYKLVDENSIKTIMKPNYITGRLPAGIYTTGQTVSVSASITTTRGNPVFISYSGDFNNVDPGSAVPWISFELFVDGQLVQRTVVDNSVAVPSDNTSFAGSALAVLSAGSHTIRLDAVLNGGSTGKIHFQEQDNLVNLVAFEL